MASNQTVTKIAHMMECWALCVHHADGYFCRFCVRLQYIEDESNMIVFKVDSLFSDFGRFVIMGFFVDPPAVGPVFPVKISQVVAMKGAGQKTGGQQYEGGGRRDEPAFCNERSHDGTNPLRLSFILSFRPFRWKLNPFFRSIGCRSDICLNHHARIVFYCPVLTAIYLIFFSKALMMAVGCFSFIIGGIRSWDSALLAIDLKSGAAAIALLFAIFQYLKRTAGPARWADSARSHRLQQVRRHLLAAGKDLEHARDWRPQLLAFTQESTRRAPLLVFTAWIEGGSGFSEAVPIVEGEQPTKRKPSKRSTPRIKV